MDDVFMLYKEIIHFSVSYKKDLGTQDSVCFYFMFYVVFLMCLIWISALAQAKKTQMRFMWGTNATPPPPKLCYFWLDI
jgi:hypothetical protein